MARGRLSLTGILVASLCACVLAAACLWWPSQQSLSRPSLSLSSSGVDAHTHTHAHDEVVVVLWTSKWGGAWLSKRQPTHYSCPRNRTVHVTSNTSLVHQADFVAFHVWDDAVQPRPESRPPHQKWVAVSRESPATDRLMRGVDTGMGSAEFTSRFDYSWGYRRVDAIRDSFFPPAQELFETLLRPVSVPFEEKLDVAVVWISSNCAAHNARHTFVEELMRHMAVHSFGKCFHNQDLPRQLRTKKLSPDLVDFIAQYKLVIAVENSACEDYVTEKLYRAWQAGVIPVVASVRGVPDYSRFAPNAHAFIDAADFPSVHSLAQHLRDVASNETLYHSYLSYRSATQRQFDSIPRPLTHRTLHRFGFSHRFLEVSREPLNPWCDMAELLQPSPLHPSPLQPDLSCQAAGVTFESNALT